MLFGDDNDKKSPIHTRMRRDDATGYELVFGEDDDRSVRLNMMPQVGHGLFMPIRGRMVGAWAGPKMGNRQLLRHPVTMPLFVVVR